jgi:hypothetical protein
VHLTALKKNKKQAVRQSTWQSKKVDADSFNVGGEKAGWC